MAADQGNGGFIYLQVPMNVETEALKGTGCGQKNSKGDYKAIFHYKSRYSLISTVYGSARWRVHL